MPVKKTYSCSLCKREIAPNNLYGVCYRSKLNLSLGDADSTEDVHICHGCAKQLYDELVKDFGF